MAITQINQGRLAEAVDMLDDAVGASSQPNFSAHLARGTARALQRKLKGTGQGHQVLSKVSEQGQSLPLQA